MGASVVERSRRAEEGKSGSWRPDEGGESESSDGRSHNLLCLTVA